MLAGFADIGELMRAVRASASLPKLGGEAPVFGGERMVDGGLIEPIPVQTALRVGATHMLVLRLRPAGYRQPTLRGLGEAFTMRDEPGLVELLRARPRVYNRQAEELQRRVIDDSGGAHVQQVAVPDHTRLVGRLEGNAERVTDALRLGARAMASSILTEPIDLCWQPVVYRARPSRGAATQPARTPASAPNARAPAAETSA